MSFTVQSVCFAILKESVLMSGSIEDGDPISEGWNFNSGNYLFTTDTK